MCSNQEDGILKEHITSPLGTRKKCLSSGTRERFYEEWNSTCKNHHDLFKFLQVSSMLFYTFFSTYYFENHFYCKPITKFFRFSHHNHSHILISCVLPKAIETIHIFLASKKKSFQLKLFPLSILPLLFIFFFIWLKLPDARSTTETLEPYKIAEIFSIVPEYDGNSIFFKTFISSWTTAQSMTTGNQLTLLVLHIKKNLKVVQTNC